MAGSNFYLIPQKTHGKLVHVGLSLSPLMMIILFPGGPNTLQTIILAVYPSGVLSGTRTHARTHALTGYYTQSRWVYRE